MIGRAMRQLHSGIWQSLTRSRRLIPGGLGDRHPHASALTGRTEPSFDAWKAILPEVFELVRRQGRVAHRGHDRPVAASPTSLYVAFNVAFGGKADMPFCAAHVCL